MGEIDLTPQKSLDEQLEILLKNYPSVLPFEKLQALLSSQRWTEIHPYMEENKILHLFDPMGEYIYSINGNITKGKYKLLISSQTLVLEKCNAEGSILTAELFELVYADQNYLFLSKHGDQRSFDQRKFLALGEESEVSNKSLEEIMEELGKESYFQFSTLFWVLVMLLLAGAILFFSL
jgi:hypothetical protein